MFKFGRDIPLDKLVGQTVWWISFSEVGAKISFKSGDEIVIFDFEDFSINNGWQTDYSTKVLIGIGHSELSGFILKSEFEIALTFTNGTKLSLHDFDSNTENFDFKIDGESYIV